MRNLHIITMQIYLQRLAPPTSHFRSCFQERSLFSHFPIVYHRRLWKRVLDYKFTTF